MMDFPANLNGWTIYAHPCFDTQYKELADSVEALKEKFPGDYQKKKETKILAHMLKSVSDIIHDPRSPAYRPGDSIGDKYTNWSRAKFGAGRYRLFFRYSFADKIIVLAWFNDGDTLRTYGSKTDAYNVFSKMLDKGNPPDSWSKLLKTCLAELKKKRSQ